MSVTNSSPRPFDILLVEDNDDDILLTKHAFKKLPWPAHFHVARDGLEALELLRRGADDERAKLPDIILLDLNMPRMDGRQLLVELKRDLPLAMIPTIVLTTSAAEDDVNHAYRRHASAYMTKPIDLDEFTQRVQRFAGFWLSGVAVLPKPVPCRAGSPSGGFMGDA
jgi:CheY-like chemotaxis protein